ncbi:MAG TPA: hypothetical protein IAB71_01705 [Candidatus Scatomonas pullistercoris]|uniref:DUF5105 domain-containing protein n=1 Tax=Candidatus Scatomonas pullistercoris TaxID=2840920 RepID=A0A9D1TAA9_9FIRM|nr:hypothetical protein [Candidatus Scatomonas pullistercoris]
MKKLFIGALAVCLTAALSACQKKADDSLEADLRVSLDTLIQGEDLQDSYIYETDLWNSVQGGSPELDAVRSKITYKITDAEEGSAKVQFFAPDVLTILETAVSEGAGDTQELLDALEDSLRGSFPIKEFQTELELRQVEDHWYLLPNDELNNALSGGLMEAYTDHIREWIDGQGGDPS